MFGRAVARVEIAFSTALGFTAFTFFNTATRLQRRGKKEQAMNARGPLCVAARPRWTMREHGLGGTGKASNRSQSEIGTLAVAPPLRSAPRLPRLPRTRPGPSGRLLAPNMRINERPRCLRLVLALAAAIFSSICFSASACRSAARRSFSSRPAVCASSRSITWQTMGDHRKSWGIIGDWELDHLASPSSKRRSSVREDACSRACRERVGMMVR